MKETRILMGMPVTVEIVDAAGTQEHNDATFAYFAHIDGTFSTHKPESEISRINAGRVAPEEYSPEMQTVFALAEETKTRSNGFFDIRSPKGIDPSGVVKGWAIHQAAERLRRAGLRNFYVEAGGDIAAAGFNEEGEPWRIGIRNPFNIQEIVKVIAVSERGVATSGTYIRGKHIYDPHQGHAPVHSLTSLTVIGPNADIADRYATAAFAMGEAGVGFLEDFPGLEGYSIDSRGIATYTSGFNEYVTI